MNILRLSTLSLSFAIAVFALGYVTPSVAEKPGACTSDPPHPSCKPDDPGDDSQQLKSAICTLEPGLYVIQSDGGDYVNLMQDVQCTIGVDNRGLHKLDTGADLLRTAIVNLDVANDCNVLDMTHPNANKVITGNAHIVIQTQGNLLDIPAGSEQEIATRMDITFKGLNRLTYGNQIKGIPCGAAPKIKCESNPTGAKCVAWTIDASYAQACYGGTPRVIANNCNVPFKETVGLQ